MIKYKTSEWVSQGHSDKCADYVSEYILDRLIEQDTKTRYALECQIKDYCVNLAGEITTSAQRTAYSRWVSEALNEIGYTKEYMEKFGEENTICGDRCVTSSFIREQSPDIARGVNDSGWGDQGIFFGFYCDESDEGHGYDYYLAKKIGQALYNEALKSKSLGIDIKTQVTISTDETGEKTVEEVIVAIPMVAGKEKEGIKEVKEIIKTICPADTPLIINGTGTYCKHGPIADSGTTGRKLVVDFYGGNSRIGGGCVDAETEYMSDNGWKKISEYDGGNVGQLTDNLELEMVKPEQYIDTYHDEIYEISTEKTTNMVLSGNHNVLYRTSKGHLQKKKVSQIIEESKDTKKGSHIDIPMTFTYGFMHGKKSNYDDTTSRIIVAHCADGSVIKDGVKWNCRIRVKKDYKVKRLRALFDYGWKLLASSLIATIYNDIRQLVIGRVYSAEDLAYYNKGKQFSDVLVVNINASIDSVLLPVLSDNQDDRTRVKELTRRSIKISSYIMWPLMFGLMAVGEPFIELVLTEKWLPCVPYLYIFCFANGIMPIQTANLNAIKAMGRSDLYLKMEIIKKTGGILLILAFMNQGVLMLGISCVIYSLYAGMINMHPNKKILGYSMTEQLKDILPSFGLAAVMACAVYWMPVGLLPLILQLVIKVAVGTMIYVSGSLIFKIDSFNFLLGIVRNFLKR